MTKTLRPVISWLLFFLFLFPVSAQTVSIEVDIEDDFLKVPLQGVKVSILTTDSVLVTDSVHCVSFKMRDGRLFKEIYIVPVKAEKCDYLLRAVREGYDEVWQPVTVPSPQTKSVEVPTIKMRKMQSVVLDEVVVKATKIKMYCKGDTLIYDADAFKLPDGSMLDALIKQLPGVTMNDGGEIFVNGRKIDELMLGSRSFMQGNKKVLMENLPYYTVKNIKVYDKQTDKSEVLGYDVEPRRYVMDVNLKDEYSRGCIANMEAAGGTENRWLGRGFALGFTRLWRYALMGNLNNVNEERHIGEQGHWSPATQPQSVVTARSVAADLDYQSADKKVADHFNADYISTGTNVETRQRYEQFLDGSKPVSLSGSNDNSKRKHLKLLNTLTLKKKNFFEWRTHFDYEKRNAGGNSYFNQWDDDWQVASMRTDDMSEGRTWSVEQELGGTFNINKEAQRFLTYNLYFRHSDDQSWLSKRYDTWQAAAQENDVRHNANDIYNRATNLLLSANYTATDLFGKVNMIVGEKFQYSNTLAYDYLYHPDTLLLASQLDMLTAITDPSNSYNSRLNSWQNNVQISFVKTGSYQISPDSPIKIVYERWRVGVDVPVLHRSLDYKRGIIDTLLCNTWTAVSPNASFRFVSHDGKRDFRLNAKYRQSPVDLLNRIGFRDDSRPLVVQEGNPNLKGAAVT
ncbi:MAG: hypothetical protein NC206_06805, partial [Bacteroides sp.]|nr:hypothetical protein [Bacteroides sp.]